MTIEEFAKTIGVSTTTVSRTISGRGRISHATREMIFKRMKELGYTPNVTAQRLVTGRTQTILLDYGEAPALIDVFTFELVRGVHGALAKRSYGLLLNASLVGLPEPVSGGAVDGVILIGDDDSSETAASAVVAAARRIAERGVPCVLISHRPVIGIPRVGSVVVDLQSGVREAARMFWEQGHRRIGFIGSRPADKVLLDFRSELQGLGGSLPDSYVDIAGTTAEDGLRAMQTLLQRPQPPTAVFARLDILAAGAIRGAHRLGIRVPEDVSLIGHDDMPFASLIEPRLTTVRVDCARLGEEAAELLIQLIDDPNLTPSAQVIPTALVVRETVMAPYPTEK